MLRCGEKPDEMGLRGFSRDTFGVLIADEGIDQEWSTQRAE